MPENDGPESDAESDAESDRYDRLERELEGSLERIAAQAQQIVDGHEAFDPDGTIDALAVESSVVEDVLAELMAVADAELLAATRGTDIAALVRDESERLQKQPGRMLVIELKLGRSLPRMPLPEPALREMVVDLLHMGAAAAGRGGTLAVVCERGACEVVLRLMAYGGSGTSDPPTGALGDVAATLGGRLQAERDSSGTFHATLTLPAAIPFG